VQAWGTGALNVDGCRVGTDEQLGRLNHTTSKFVDSANGSRDAHPRTILVDNSAGKGRWPSNVVLDGGMADELDKQSGTLASGWRNTDSAVSDGATYGWGGDRTGQHYADSGGASRFFPVFKYSAKAPGTERPTADGVAHPTVKPLDLMRWLVRLVTPPNGVVLDPFAGSGTTGEAAIHEHKRAILIEREPSYLPLIVARLSKPMAVGFDFEVGA
jgi:site-specific DNA-methyltransferase (adenine-specific)